MALEREVRITDLRSAMQGSAPSGMSAAARQKTWDDRQPRTCSEAPRICSEDQVGNSSASPTLHSPRACHNELNVIVLLAGRTHSRTLFAARAAAVLALNVVAWPALAGQIIFDSLDSAPSSMAFAGGIGPAISGTFNTGPSPVHVALSRRDGLAVLLFTR